MHLITYGTLLLRDENILLNGKVVEIKGYRRLHKYDWSFPFIIEDKNASFRAVMFDVDEDQLKSFDRYEGVPHLYIRKLIKVREVETNKLTSTFIYYPSESTIENHELDKINVDFWNEQIMRFANHSIYNFAEEEREIVYRKLNLLLYYNIFNIKIEE